MKNTLNFLLLLGFASLQPVTAQETTGIWLKYEISFKSDLSYDNPLYDAELSTVFTSPTGRKRRVNGFWDGGKDWKVRFLPDEIGTWVWQTSCSDESNSGLHNQDGTFNCMQNNNEFELYQRGSIKHIPGKYHLSYADGTPFFWLACTAWNGGLLSTDRDWDDYLDNRKNLKYNAIQFVTTQWRGGEKDRDGQVAFTGSGKIEVSPDFFKSMDKRVDRINEHGLVAVPVLLWALHKSNGRHFSPGYYLPIDEASLLAKYIVARYQGNQVVWFLGGDGHYVGDLEDRWLAIGEQVFGDIDHAPATLHPHGISYVGDVYGNTSWYDIMGYQSSHGFTQRPVDWINKGPMAQNWDKLKPIPYINIEPLYENIRENQTSENVRNAIWWSLFATPVAGVTYGANGIWPWLEEDGAEIQNHGQAPWTKSWKNSVDLPVSKEMKIVYEYFASLDWTTLIPSNSLLVEQPGEDQFDQFVSTLSNDDYSVITAYVPAGSHLKFRNMLLKPYEVSWFDPLNGSYKNADRNQNDAIIDYLNGSDHGMVLLLKEKLK